MQNTEIVIELLRDLSQTMPELSFGELLTAVLPSSVYDYDEHELEEALKQAYLQNM